jgi:hypothetical protein
MRVDDHASIAYAAASARTPRPPRVATGQYSGGHDAHKTSTRRQHKRLAYVMRVDNRASVGYAAASCRPRLRSKIFDAVGLRIARLAYVMH